MNVIVVSTERCAVSWMGCIISDVFKGIHDCPIEWNYEISRLMAISQHYALPREWNTVYYVRPESLLKRGYDKVIVLERDLEIVKRILLMYHDINLHYDECKNDPKYISYFLKIEKYWNIVYGERIEDERLLWVKLRDLNDFSIATFSEIFDFLEFPTKRPVLIPISPPERNWETHSSIIPKGWGLDARLMKIEALYNNKKCESEKVSIYKPSTQPVSNPHREKSYSPTLLEMQRQGGSFRLFYHNPVPDVLEELGLL